MNVINGKSLLDMGYKPGSWFGDAIRSANYAVNRGESDDVVRMIIASFAPVPIETLRMRHRSEMMPRVNLTPTNKDETANFVAVREHMIELMRVPTVVDGAIMPDACPSDSTPGTIPVGGVISTKEAIHPGMHSADICCSVAISVFDDVDPKDVLDVGQAITHFGPGGRPRGKQFQPPSYVMDMFAKNPFLSKEDIFSASIEHFATQGDGNHFMYVSLLVI